MLQVRQGRENGQTGIGYIRVDKFQRFECRVASEFRESNVVNTRATAVEDKIPEIRKQSYNLESFPRYVGEFERQSLHFGYIAEVAEKSVRVRRAVEVDTRLLPGPEPGKLFLDPFASAPCFLVSKLLERPLSQVTDENTQKREQEDRREHGDKHHRELSSRSSIHVMSVSGRELEFNPPTFSFYDDYLLPEGTSNH